MCRNTNSESEKIRIALLTNNDDDVYCFRKEVIEAMIESENEELSEKAQAFHDAFLVVEQYAEECDL